MVILPKKILLATDGSEGGAMATQAAVDLSNRIGSELHVAHAWAPIHHNTYPVTCCSRTPDYSRLYAKDARRLIAEQIEQIENNGEIPGVVTEAHLRKGRPINEINRLSEELGADLIVLGGKGYNPARRMLMGRFSKNFVRHASCPTLVVPGRTNGWPPSRVVIGEDLSEYDEGVGELAASLGRLFRVRLLQVQASLKPCGGSAGTRVLDTCTVEDLSSVITDATLTGTILAVAGVKSFGITRRMRPSIESLNPFNVFEAPRWSILVSPRLPCR